jgi:Tol biopolymer transport system component
MKKIVFGLMVSAFVLSQSLAYTQSSINEVVISKKGEDKAYSPPDDIVKKHETVTKEYALPNNIDISGSENGIIKLPKEVPAIYHNIFDRYTKVNAPNGKPIHILIQDIWTDDQIVQARNVMEYILKDYQGSEYGTDKSIIANTMADNHATLILIENEESLMSEEIEKIFINAGLFMQDLRANEIPVIGSDEYMTHTVRDASFEEILHLVHASGIMPGYKSYDDKIQAASDAAEKWAWVGWPDAEPQSHYLEYYAVMLDRHLDLKRIKPTVYEGNGIWQKPAKRLRLTNYPLGGSREEVIKNDPQGYEIIEEFFHPYLTYMPALPADFKGIFSVKYNEDLPYTYKSRYLKDVKLRGENRAILIGNNQANTLIGNAGNNDFIGNEGDDVIDGAGGEDKVFFTSKFEHYVIIDEGEEFVVIDRRGDGDGKDRLTNIETLQFEDLTYDLAKLEFPELSVLFWSADIDGNPEIYTMSLDGKFMRRLSFTEEFDEMYPSFSPDGSKILFESNRDGDFDLYVMNADGSNAVKLTENDADDLSSSWSNNGSKITFVSFAAGEQSEIYVMDADGSNLKQVSSNKFNEEAPTFSPDMKQIAFDSEMEEGPNQICIIDVKTGETRQLTKQDHYCGYPRWSPDGSRITFDSYGDKIGSFIFSIKPDGTDFRKLTNDGFASNATWSADASTILYSGFYSNKKNSDVTIMNRDGNSSRKIISRGPVMVAPSASTAGLKSSKILSLKDEEKPWGNIDSKLANLINEFFHPSGDDKDIYSNSTKADFEAQIKRAELFLKKLKKIKYDKLDLLNQNDYDYFHAQIDNQLQSLKEWSLWEKNPSLYISFDGYFAASLDKSISDEQRYQNMITAIEGGLNGFGNGMDNLSNPPKVWVEKAIKYAGNVYKYMQKRMPKIIENAPNSKLKTELKKVADAYTENLLNYQKFLSGDLLAKSDGNTVMGRKEYERALKNYFVDYSVEELIKIGRNAFSENIALLEATAKEIDPEKTWQELIDENRLDHVAPWELFDNLKKEAARAKELVYKHMVNVPSDMKEEYHYTKDGHPGTYPIGASGIGPFVFMENGVYNGYYALPTIEDYDGLKRKNEFMLDWNDSWYVVQQIPHEVYPGHHFQNFMLYRNERPARILNGVLPYTEISATMTEGWSVYNEATMYKLGYYKNDKRLYLSHLQHQLWRKVRVYAEPLYHTGQISFDEVMEMFKEAGTSDGQAWVEATQLTEMPGHDATYYMGVVMMKELIQDYKDIVGEDNFDLKEFNTRLLECGFIALPLAAKEVLEFAKEKVKN